ncbi:GNAT family N-acetyltransferase [Cellulomonas cellasea]|uniref:GNAT family N-acetyltransferase n=1 Tax=Cellulomonas cellasea TaxID=43670 RepID=UPI0025A39A6E|nr:GNAT family N-acetyltransferase [Cellulomonas cellasea]MDM8084098.1 GNAT family N-acetyltransferase [Cellulomonas cellasea]
MRPAEPGDLPALVDLCLAARSESTMGAQLCSDDGDRLRDQLGALLASPGGQLLVGLLDGEPAGLLLGQLVGPGPFTDLVSLNLEAIYVAPRARRRGLGHALMAGALEVAELGGATEVYAAPLPGARGMQRFFVRLGFAPAAAHRVVSTSALQRRLVGETAGAQSRRASGRGLEDLIARRRQVRAAARGEAVDPGSVQDAGQRSRPAITMQVNRAVQTLRESESSTTIS